MGPTSHIINKTALGFSHLQDNKINRCFQLTNLMLWMDNQKRWIIFRENDTIKKLWIFEFSSESDFSMNWCQFFRILFVLYHLSILLNSLQVRFDHMVLACSKAFKSAVVDTIQSLPQHQQVVFLQSWFNTVIWSLKHSTFWMLLVVSFLATSFTVNTCFMHNS